jgi:hypothetical protein
MQSKHCSFAIMSTMGQMDPRAYQCVPYNRMKFSNQKMINVSFKDKQIKSMSNLGIAMTHHNENYIGS